MKIQQSQVRTHYIAVHPQPSTSHTRVWVDLRAQLSPRDDSRSVMRGGSATTCSRECAGLALAAAVEQSLVRLAQMVRRAAPVHAETALCVPGRHLRAPPRPGSPATDQRLAWGPADNILSLSLLHSTPQTEHHFPMSYEASDSCSMYRKYSLKNHCL